MHLQLGGFEVNLVAVRKRCTCKSFIKSKPSLVFSTIEKDLKYKEKLKAVTLLVSIRLLGNIKFLV